MDDFYQQLVDGLEQAKQNKERLLRELEVTDILIQAQEQAISYYSGNGGQPSPKKQRARRGDKTGIIVGAINQEPFGITKEELYHRVKDEGIDRNYLSKVLFRLKAAGKVSEDGTHWFMVV
jgi:hypothetical protein